MKVGYFNHLVAARPIAHGFILVDEQENEVLLPKMYVDDSIKLGESVEVFLYYDSEDRIVATTLKPKLTMGEFKCLDVVDVNKFGAFMDWGLPKDIFVPFSEQLYKMEAGRKYLVCLVHDKKSDRLFASSKIFKYTHNKKNDLKEGQQVSILPYGKSKLGVKVLIENKYDGLVFHSDVHKRIIFYKEERGYIKNIREDGKIDVVLENIGYNNSIEDVSRKILQLLKKNDGFIAINDNSSPQLIKSVLGVSKKAFKKGIGKLYKHRKIEIEKHGIRLR